jgi:hypothetical protein
MKVSIGTVCSGVMLLTLFCWTSVEGWAQPQHSINLTTTVTPSSIPFDNQSLNRVQWVFYPSDFGTAPSGNITKVYFKRQPSMLPVINSYTNLTIKMGETGLSMLPPGPWVTAGMTTVFQASTYDFIPAPGDWMPVTLQTPFNYTGTSNFIVEVSHGGFGVGFEVMQAAMTGRSVYGSTMSAMSNAQNVLVEFGFDIGVGGTDVSLEGITGIVDTLCTGSQLVSVNLQNNGPANLHSATINWKVNNILQPTVYWNGTLAASNTTIVSLGNYSFSAGIPYIVTAWTSNPNNQADPDPSNDTTTIGIAHVYAAPTATPAANLYNICHGDSVQLTGSLTGIPPWSLSIGDGTTVFHLQNLTAPTYGLWVSPVSTTTYTFQSVSDGSGCPGTLSSPVQVTVHSNPTINAGPDQTIKMSDSIELTAISSGVTYLWSTGATTPSIWVKGAELGAGSHLFSVTVANPYQCTGSDSVTVTVIDDTGIEMQNQKTHFTVRPNPTFGMVVLHITARHPGIAHLEVLGLDGVLRFTHVAELNLGNQTVPLDLNNLTDGLYLIRMRTETYTTVKKLIIRK